MFPWWWPQPQKKPACVHTMYFKIHSWTRKTITGRWLTIGVLYPVWRLVYQTQRSSPLPWKGWKSHVYSALWKTNPRIVSWQRQHIPSINMWQMLEMWSSNPTFQKHIFFAFREGEREARIGLIWLVIIFFWGCHKWNCIFRNFMFTLCLQVICDSLRFWRVIAL